MCSPNIRADTQVCPYVAIDDARTVDAAFAGMMPILKWLALRASEMLGIAPLTPTYTNPYPPQRMRPSSGNATMRIVRQSKKFFSDKESK
jgi:hypothetical protein